MALDLKSGGHLSHGYKTEKKKISATSKYFETEFYYVNKEGYIDYKEIEEKALKFKPKIIICGASYILEIMIIKNLEIFVKWEHC